jgi:hypothetical protein
MNGLLPMRMKNGESLIDKSIRAVIVVLCHSYSDSLEVIGSSAANSQLVCLFGYNSHARDVFFHFFQIQNVG